MDVNDIFNHQFTDKCCFNGENMNIKNNKRRQNTRETIEKVFIELLQSKEISQISVSDICKTAGYNRSTFYANYMDVYDLADKIRDKLEAEVSELYGNDIYYNCGLDYLKLFCHIRENQLFYTTYFKLGYDAKHEVDLGSISQNQVGFPKENLDYHIEFHKAGLNAVIKKWLASGCIEPPEAMVKIIQDEYINRN